jgi:hypothetical protein
LYDVVDVVLFFAGLVALLATSARYAAEFPFLDDWAYCDFYLGQSYWEFVRSPYNEHIMWVSKALTLPLVAVTGWNTRLCVLAGLGVYAAATSLFFLLIRRQTASLLLRGGAALLLVLPGTHENLVWAWQTTFHLCYLFGVCGLWALELAPTPDSSAGASRPVPDGSRRAVLFGMAAVFGELSLFSVGAGVAYALGLAAALTLAAFVGVARPGREFWAAVGSAALLGASVLYYLHISPRSPFHPPLLLPWQDPGLFARLLVSGLGLGITFPHDPEVAFRAGILSLIVIALGTALAVRRAGRAIAVVAAFVTALIAPAMIAVARGRFGWDAAVASRYLEINIVVALPIFWALGRLHARRSRVLKTAAVVLALAAPANAARMIGDEIARMATLQFHARQGRQCWRENGAATKCAGKVSTFPQYVTDCLEMIHARWGNWGHLGGD